MAAVDHYAVLLAINRYPGLSDLAGPENDALAFREWLLDPDGGALEPAHVALIKSSDFANTTDPYDANPTDSQLKKVLNQWLKTDGKWRDRVGQRIYLFFAGHGFTAGTLTDPVLFTAQAQLDDRTYIAAYRYACKIVNAGFFDEVVFLMDCCQDVLKAASIAEPSWSPPDRMCSDKVQFMVALGAPRGRKAFEQSPVPAPATPQAQPPAVHGYFSSVFLDALRTAPSDAQGYVTARAVEATFGTLWTQRYLERTGYEPPFIAPRDMKLYRRSSAAGVVPAATPPSAMAAAIAKLVATPVKIASRDRLAHIRLFDARHRVVGNAIGGLGLDLPQGEYLARVRLGGGGGGGMGTTVHDHALTIGAPELVESIELPDEEFASPVPASWSASRHEYHHGPAEEWLAKASQVSPWPHSTATLLVFARDSAHQQGKPWRMGAELRNGLRLQRIMPDSGQMLPVAVDLQVDAGCAFAAFKIDLPAGNYVLGARRRLRNRWVWDEMLLTLVSNGWRTEVWLDSEDDEQDQRRFDLDAASVLLARSGDGNWFDSQAARSTELLRSALLPRPLLKLGDSSEQVPDLAIEPEQAGPMATLYAATAIAQQAKPDLHRLREWLHWLSLQWNPNSADVLLLSRWCDLASAQGAQPIQTPLILAPDAAPVLSLNWRLLLNPLLHVRLAPVIQRSLGMWRTEGELWFQMQRPDAHTGIGEHALLHGEPLPRLPDGQLDMASIANNLLRPDPRQSPLHQTLRNQLMDARDAGDSAMLANVVHAVSEASALDADVVMQALAELWAGPNSCPTTGTMALH